MSNSKLYTLQFKSVFSLQRHERRWLVRDGEGVCFQLAIIL